MGHVGGANGFAEATVTGRREGLVVANPGLAARISHGLVFALLRWCPRQDSN